MARPMVRRRRLTAALLAALSLAAIAGAVVSTTPALARAPVAEADFDGDGVGDVAIGIPGEGVDGKASAGAVQVLYGSTNGLTDRDQFLTQNTDGVKGKAEADDLFGQAIAVGDFDDDGFSDLAIGVPGEGVDGEAHAGAINVLNGSADGLTTAGDQFISQNSQGIKRLAEESDNFGGALAADDFDDDGNDDLAIGIPNEGVFGEAGAGAVAVLYGGSSLTDRDDFITQESQGIKGHAEAFDGFGATLASGNFDGEGADDLAIGVPGENGSSGGVAVLYAGEGGITNDDQFLSQDDEGIKGKSEPGDFWGFALAGGDYDDDGNTDLAIGAPFEGVGAADSAGAVSVIYGGASKLSDRDQRITQDTAGIKGSSQSGDGFGFDLATGDFDGDGTEDLATSAVAEDVGDAVNAGRVHVIYGGGSGLTRRDQAITQDTSGIKGTAEQNDLFGRALNAGDVNGDGEDDLLVGVPLEDVGSTPDAGLLAVIYGGGSGLTDRDDAVTQDTNGVKGKAEPQDVFSLDVEG